MQPGKLTDEKLNQLILNRLPVCSDKILVGPGTGLDCSIIKTGKGCVAVSSDPITGAVADIGRLAVHISCNDIACTGIKPSVLTLVIIAPPDTTEETISTIIDQVSETAKFLEVDIVGGHTEISDSVNRLLLITTALGFATDCNQTVKYKIKVNDSILMTKYAAIEGTTIIANDYPYLIDDWSDDDKDELRNLNNLISVVPEGVICGRSGVHAMHDITEGGVLGAVWEVSKASGFGCIVDTRLIPVLPLTARLCKRASIDPMRLISSGSMIVVTDNPEHIIAELGNAGIICAKIGKITDGHRIYIDESGNFNVLTSPLTDELYKIK